MYHTTQHQHMTQKESELCIVKENNYCGLQWFEATISDNCKCFKYTCGIIHASWV